MKKIICDKIPRISKNKKRLEKVLNVKITNRGKEVYIDGNSEDEYISEKVIEALNYGFPYSVAIAIKEEEFQFAVINIKEHTNKKDLGRVRGRIIGANGKTLKTLAKLTECYFELKDNFIGIIGPEECIENAKDGIISLIKGTKQSNVYSYLEKHQIKPIGDLGLKDKNKKKD